jgi:transposase
MGHYEDGSWVCAKRLEKGRFRWPSSSGVPQHVVLSHDELGLLLNGMDLEQVSRRRWYRKVAV